MGVLTANGLSCTRPRMRCPRTSVWKISWRRIFTAPWALLSKSILSGTNTGWCRPPLQDFCFSRVARILRSCVITSEVCSVESPARFEGSIHSAAGAGWSVAGERLDPYPMRLEWIGLSHGTSLSTTISEDSGFCPCLWIGCWFERRCNGSCRSESCEWTLAEFGSLG